MGTINTIGIDLPKALQADGALQHVEAKVDRCPLQTSCSASDARSSLFYLWSYKYLQVKTGQRAGSPGSRSHSQLLPSLLFDQGNK